MSAARKAKPDDLAREKGLPCNLDAERLVLGALLLDNGMFSEVMELTPDDFSLERHKQIFACMRELRSDNEDVDRVTVAEGLARRGQLGTDALSYLVTLDDGMPQVAHIASYVRIVIEKATLRRIIFAARAMMTAALLETARPAEIIEAHQAIEQELGRRVVGGAIRSVDSLASIFAGESPIEYLVEPELPAGAVVTLAGESESGKSTLVCAWARDLNARGHAVLHLDRDKNPRHTIRDRLERLGITADGPLLRIWDYQQDQEAPQPDSPIVVDWVKERIAKTGLAPFVIVDSLIAFLPEGASENDNLEMRGLFNRCRVLTRLGAGVCLLHHPGKGDNTKQGRGASDYKAASDQAFVLSNYNPDGSRLLHTLKLICTKSRYGLTGDLIYHYASGQMFRDQNRDAVSKTVSEQLTGLLRQNPGATKGQFEKLGSDAGCGRKNTRVFLDLGVQARDIRFVKNSKGPGGHYFLASDAPEAPQEETVM